MHFLLFYELSNDYLEKRESFRKQHLELAWKAFESGELVLGGALSEPVDKAVLFFKGSTEDVAKKFATADPYVKNGLVKAWYIRQWTTVVGKDPASPVIP